MKTDTDMRILSFLKHDDVSIFASFSPSEVAFIAFSFWEIPISLLINLIQIVALQGQIRCSLQILFACDVVLLYDRQLLRK